MEIVGFVKTNIENFQKIRFGRGARNKLRLLEAAILQSISKAIHRLSKAIHRLSSLDKNIEEIAEKLWRDTVIEINGIMYTLVDSESLSIIYWPESYTSIWFKPQRREVFVDIGAHIGKYTLTAAKIVEDEGIVVAIEPNPANYQALIKNIKLNNVRNVIALNLAAWDRDCLLKLFTGHLAGHHSAKINWELGWSEVKARVMDNVLEEYDIDRVDWIKIDVEGAEWEVLCGLRETIDEKRPRIVAEVSYENIDRIKEFMEERGYGLIKIAPLSEGIIYGVFRKFAYFFFLPYA